MRPVRKRRWPKIAVSVLAGAALLWLGGFVLFAVSLPTAPADESAPTDAIVVLTGGSLRLETGLRLLDAQLGKKLFVSGVHKGNDVEELMRVSRQSPSRADCCIVLGYEADNTAGNASETADWIAREGYASIRLVTAAYHMPRSLLEFSREMPSVALIAHPVFPDHVKTLEWYRYPGTALLIAGEFTKTVLVALQTGLDRVVRALSPKAEAFP